MDALATTQDLIVRGVNVDDPDTVAALLAAASAAVRRAASHPISRLTSTVEIEGKPVRMLHLPSAPVTAVTLVKIDGAAVTTWKLLPGGRLYRTDGLLWIHGVSTDVFDTFHQSWRYERAEPTVVEVTYTHGLAAVPADVVDLVCGLVAGALSAVDAGYDPGIGVQSVRVDDASETYATGAAARGGHMELPESTRMWLATEFGGGAYSVGGSR